jgi:PAS domain S-box-containing protein
VGKRTNEPAGTVPSSDPAPADAGNDSALQPRLPARAWLAAIIDSSDDAIVSKTLEGVITSWNTAAERMFGYTASEVIGRSITVIIPPDRLFEETEVIRKIRLGELVDHFETVRVRKDGRPIEISLTVSPIRGDDGQIVGASKIARDISDRKRIERERDALLLATQEASRSKDVFLAMLGHELRNPLNAIVTGIRLLKEVGSPEPAAVRAREIISRQTQNLTKLVNDMLDVGRAVTGKIELDLETFDLGEIVRGCVSVLSGGGNFAHHALRTEIGTVSVHADRVRVEQIVENLVSNALKYTPSGGWIRIAVARQGDKAVLEVADNGIGMSPELCRKVFDLFVQGESKLERSQGGLGLGLTLVQRLAALHGGSAVASSEGPGRGSHFVIRLPAQPEPSQPVAAPRPKASPGGRRILIVEDNADAREMLRDFLVYAGHEVHEAHSGPEGVESALRLRPDVTLVDIGLPLLDGYEVAHRIRADPRGGELFLIALTGYGSVSDRARALDAGFDRHLVKPVDVDELDRLLASPPRPNERTRS